MDPKINYKTTLLYYILFSLVSCKNKTDNYDIIKLTEVDYEITTYNIGNIKQNDSIIFFIKYKNVGQNSLVINFAKSSCNCSGIEYSKEPLIPEKNDSLKIIFYAPKEIGLQTKTIIIAANTVPTLTQVFLTANVIEKK